MITDRVIALIETNANMAGVEKAKAGFGGLNLSTLALGAALGGLILVGKDAIKNTEEMDKAHRSLEQATKATHKSFDGMQSAFDAWAEANKRYIPNQYAAETALAAFVRAGNSAKDSMRMLNDALDLSTLRGIDMATAQSQIEKAVMGSTKALKDLGISTADVTKIVHSHMTTEQKHLAILHLIEAKTKDGRKAQTDLTQSTQAMNKDWQDITTRVGPPLMALLGGIVSQGDKFVKWLNDVGNNKTWNKAVSKGLGEAQDLLVGVVKGFERFANWMKWLRDSAGGIWSGFARGFTNAYDEIARDINKLIGVFNQLPHPGISNVASLPILDTPGVVPGPPGSRQIIAALGGERFGGAQSIGAGSGGGGVTLIINGGTFMDHGPTIDAISNALLRYARHRPGR